MQPNPTSPSEAQLDANPIDTQRLPKVKERTGLGRSTIYRMMALGQFPRSLQLTARAVGWRRADIDAWLAARPPAPHCPRSTGLFS